MKSPLLSRTLFWASLAVFGISLAVPAYVTGTERSSQAHYGLEALLLGPIGLFAGHFSWLANLLLLGAWTPRDDTLVSSSFAVMGLLIALTFLFGNTVAVGRAGEYPYRVAIGYFLWITSFVLVTAALLTRPDQPVAEHASQVAP